MGTGFLLPYLRAIFCRCPLVLPLCIYPRFRSLFCSSDPKRLTWFLSSNLGLAVCL